MAGEERTLEVLAHCDGNCEAVAKELGITARAQTGLISAHDIET